MRKAPRPPANAPRISPQDAHHVQDERTYRFLTPMFGGGVRLDNQHKDNQHKLHDPVTPVRAASIRGQLRFWWRACNPERCIEPEDLHEREERTFGSAQVPSALSIAVVKQPDRVSDVQVFKDRFVVVDRLEGRAYGAFPLRAQDNGTDHGVLHELHGNFTVALRYPTEMRDGVEAALWAFAHFGGLGGRTRRGFGAIAEIGGKLASIDEGWAKYVGGVEGVPWAHLPAFDKRRLRLKSGFGRGDEAQEYLLAILRRLRQGDIGRRREADDVPGRHPGRSYWPEPDTIRDMLGQRSPSHAKPVTAIRAFPRAAYGMPIVFHFKDRRDPSDTSLLPTVQNETKGRLASPLLLRPHQGPDGSIDALALILAHPQSDGLVLVGRSNEHAAAPWRNVTKEALHMGVGGRPSPLVTKHGKVVPDPLDRFLEEVR